MATATELASYHIVVAERKDHTKLQRLVVADIGVQKVRVVPPIAKQQLQNYNAAKRKTECFVFIHKRDEAWLSVRGSCVLRW